MTRYLLIQRYEGGNCDVPMGRWDPADIRRHLAFQQSLTDELVEAGELIDAQGVAADARRVTSDGETTTVTVPEGETLLAGYRLVDVTADRVVEIAARCSAAPGPGGRAMELPIEIRETLSPRLLS